MEEQTPVHEATPVSNPAPPEPSPDVNGVPKRFGKALPPGLVLPKGRMVWFITFRGVWTDTPKKGARRCVLWPINAGDKRFAAGRAMGDPNRMNDELAKQMIRAFDMSEAEPLVAAESAGVSDAGNVEVFWNEIGERCRGQLLRHYHQIHYLTPAETADFLLNCVDVRSAVG